MTVRTPARCASVHGVAHLHARRVDDANHAGPYELVLDHICLLRDVGDVSRGIRTMPGTSLSEAVSSGR